MVGTLYSFHYMSIIQAKNVVNLSSLVLLLTTIISIYALTSLLLKKSLLNHLNNFIIIILFLYALIHTLSSHVYYFNFLSPPFPMNPSERMNHLRKKLPLPIIITTICILVFTIVLYAERLSFLSSSSIFKFKTCPRKHTKLKPCKLLCFCFFVFLFLIQFGFLMV